MTGNDRQFYKGDYVTVPGTEYTGVYEVHRVTAARLHLRNVVTGQGVTCPPRSRALAEATAEQVGEALKTVPKADISLGTVVRYPNPKAPEGLYVVIKLHSDGLFNVARLGGDGNRYFSKVHPGTVTVIPASKVAQALAGLSGD